MSGNHLLEIKNLKIDVRVTKKRRLSIVDTASLIIEPGQIIGLIGESGSGKTMLCRSLVGTLGRRGAYIASGQLKFDGIDLISAKQSVWNEIRGKRIGYVPQSALAGPNPVMTIGAQLAEAILQDENFPKADLEKRSLELLNIVQIRRPETVLKQYQHELSGGMKQRVMIACAIAQQPQLIVADEPTKDFNTSIILVSHDLPLINEICDDIVVMHAGTTVEKIPSKSIKASKHPYTLALYNSRIDLVVPKGQLKTINGQPPSVGSWPEGCRFSERCDFVKDKCRVKQDLPLITIGTSHETSCLRYDEIAR